jgi:hypothetical protein
LLNMFIAYRGALLPTALGSEDDVGAGAAGDVVVADVPPVYGPQPTAFSEVELTALVPGVVTSPNASQPVQLPSL